MKRLKEYRAFTQEGRLIGRETAIDQQKLLRSLGCPKEVIDRIERKNAARAAGVEIEADKPAAPAVNEDFASTLNALKAL